MMTDASRNDPQKYIFGRTELHRIPRWPNDGMEEHRREHANSQQLQRSHLASVHPTQRAITELLGEWPSGSAYTEIESGPMGSGFFLSLPYMIQKKAADEQQDLLAAKSHLINAYKSKDAAVRDLLDKSGLKSAVHKASRDSNRFPPFAAVVAPLLVKKLATDANLELLFGDVANVRGVLLELGPDIKDPPPKNSPADAALAPLLGQQKVSPGQKLCAECGATEGQEGKTLRRCASCFSIHYCSRDCQTKAWPMHKPDCLAAQGKPVSAAVRAKAVLAKEAREEASKKKEEEKKSQYLEAANAAWQAFCNEDSSQADQYLYDCGGKRLKVHLPLYGVEMADTLAGSPLLGLEFEERLSLGMFPDGIDSERYNFRGTLYSDPSNGDARIILLFTYLYESAVEPSDCAGYYIDGIFVVDRIVGKRAKWKLVPEPRLDRRDGTRLMFLGEYLKAAKEKAKAVQQDVDLGIHNPGDPPLHMTNTPNGNFMTISSEGEQLYPQDYLK